MADMTSKLSEMNIGGSPVNKCANCGKQGDQRCSGCTEGLDIHGKPSQVFYCGKDCQREHWHASHKVECKVAKDRKLLYRIGTLLQWLFYEIRIALWYPDITRMDREFELLSGNPAKLLVTLGEKSGPELTNFSTFPRNVFKKEDEDAILVHGAGRWAVTTMPKAVDNLTEALRTRAAVHEVTIRPQAGQRVTFVPEELAEFEDISTHYLFRITLSDGSMYAMDVCSAQFFRGIRSENDCCVFPWEPYLRSLSVADGDLLNTCELDAPTSSTQSSSFSITPKDVQDAQAGLFKQEYMSLVIQTLAESTIKYVFESLTKVSHKSPAQLMRLPEEAYDRLFGTFKHCNGIALEDLSRHWHTGYLDAFMHDIFEPFLGGGESAAGDTI